MTLIDEYIAGFEGEQNKKLKVIRDIIKKAAPKESTETINYGMPTFKYHGNLIHFAMFKNHVGIYPGAETITNFQEQLKNYKTSKGAIQLPFDVPIPEKLISALVKFNSDRLKDKVSPNWDAYHSKWEECEELMNQIIVKSKTALEKEFKWGSHIYTFQKKNVIGWGGFKDFFSLWFYNGVFLKDKYNVLVTASEGKTKSLRQWRFTDVKDMDEKKILSYIEESIQTIRDGKEIKPEKFIAKEVSGYLKDELEKNTAFKRAFEKLTPGRKKEYITYIEEAKQEKTKLSRIEKIKPLIMEGKGLHDKYK